MVEKLVNVFWDEELGLNCVDGRELYEALKAERQFDKWIKDQLKNVDAVEYSDYKVLVFKDYNLNGGRPGKKIYDSFRYSYTYMHDSRGSSKNK